MPPETPPKRVQELSAVLRTRLANERTELAWWRTGLAAVVLAIGVGQIVPQIDDNSGVGWPYALLGAGFALWGVALIFYGSRRARETEAAIADGTYQGPPPPLSLALTTFGCLLLLATAVLIVVD